jgi:copper chaperone CopZ
MQTEHIKVTGMSCGGCATKVARALNAIPGVIDARVSLPAGEATVQFDDRQTSPARLKAAVQGAGYGVNDPNPANAQKSKGCCCG